MQRLWPQSLEWDWRYITRTSWSTPKLWHVTVVVKVDCWTEHLSLYYADNHACSMYPCTACANYSLDRSSSRVSKGPRANNCHGPRLALIRQCTPVRLLAVVSIVTLVARVCLAHVVLVQAYIHSKLHAMTAVHCHRSALDRPHTHDTSTFNSAYLYIQ